MRGLGYSGMLLNLLVAWPPSLCHGFNPLPYIQAASSVAGLMANASQLTSIAYELEGLLSDLDGGSRGPSEITLKLKKIDELAARARGLGMNLYHLETLAEDLEGESSAASKIKKMREAVRASKEIAMIMRGNPQAGTAISEIQSLRLTHMIHEELVELNDQPRLTALSQKEERLARRIYLEEEKQRLLARDRGAR